MSEFPPPLEKMMTKEEYDQLKQEYLRLAQELSQKSESFPFKGLDDKAYAQLKADEDDCPGYTTPIDELINRFDALGIKVALGKSDNVYLMPLDGTDVTQDGVFPRHFKVSDSMNPELKKLILQCQTLRKFNLNKKN